MNVFGMKEMISDPAREEEKRNQHRERGRLIQSNEREEEHSGSGTDLVVALYVSPFPRY